jgi:hypothetical protein
MKYDNIQVKLLDNDGFTITEQECETVKEAKERARYYLSEAYAKESETTHAAWKTHKAEIVCDGEIIHDFFL